MWIGENLQDISVTGSCAEQGLRNAMWEIGYLLEVIVMSGSDYGCATIRKRCFVFALEIRSTQRSVADAMKILRKMKYTMESG